ncbi:unnamed protein product [Pedinophyceae sp. YPF-701]|nr:unnamed protein product [Pedinophyceae sp. YPF-701]
MRAGAGAVVDARALARLGRPAARPRASALSAPCPRPSRGRAPGETALSGSARRAARGGLQQTRAAEDEEVDVDSCYIASINVDNDLEDEYTIMQVQTQDYPGLLRIIAWVLTGLDIVVAKASLATEEDGAVDDKFWLQTRSGRKLAEVDAKLLVERMSDFINQCVPATSLLSSDVLTSANIVMDNRSEERFSVLHVCVPLEQLAPGSGYTSAGYMSSGPPSAPPTAGFGNQANINHAGNGAANGAGLVNGHSKKAPASKNRPKRLMERVDNTGLLLDFATVLNSSGITVRSAIIQQQSEVDDDCMCLLKHLDTMRQGGDVVVYVFKVTDATGSKLDFSLASGLMYSMEMVLASAPGAGLSGVRGASSPLAQTISSPAQ